jgi:hypothetical protein
MGENKNLKEQREFFNRFYSIFNNTFLEDIFQIKPEEYIEPVVEKLKSEDVISKMNEAEKIFYTILIKTYQEMLSLSAVFGIEEMFITQLIETEGEQSEELLEDLLERSELMYEINEEEFPYDVWSDFISANEKYNAYFFILNFCIYSRLMPRYMCMNPKLRKGFLIVKDSGELLEDDCSFEDEEKITTQNYPFN